MYEYSYLQVEPTVDLVILDSDSTLGGTWSQQRLYPGLVAEAHFGYEVHTYTTLQWVAWVLTIG